MLDLVVDAVLVIADAESGRRVTVLL